MTDEEIIKALECCTTKGAKCSDCPAYKKVDRSDCKKYFRGAIDLINSQKAEIERLNNELKERVEGMTVQNAIKILKTEYLGDSEYMELAKQMGAYALEKQISKKPDYEDDGYDEDGYLIYYTWICPNCGKHYEVDYDDYDFCPECGQALDWSDEI